MYELRQTRGKSMDEKLLKKGVKYVVKIGRNRVAVRLIQKNADGVSYLVRNLKTLKPFFVKSAKSFADFQNEDERTKALKAIEAKRPDYRRRSFKTFKGIKSSQSFKNIKRIQSCKKSQNYGVRQVRLRQGSRAHGLRLRAGSESTGTFRSGNARKISENTAVLRQERKVLG